MEILDSNRLNNLEDESVEDNSFASVEHISDKGITTEEVEHLDNLFNFSTARQSDLEEVFEQLEGEGEQDHPLAPQVPIEGVGLGEHDPVEEAIRIMPTLEQDYE